MSYLVDGTTANHLEQVLMPTRNTILSHSDDTSLGTKLVWNVIYSALRVLLLVPVPLLLTPFIIKHVGMQGLGLWALFLAFNNLTSLADLGFSGTLTKHISEYSAKKEFEQLNRVVNSGFFIYCSAALLVVALLNLGSGAISSVIFRHAAQLSAKQLQHAIQVLSIAFGLNVLAFPLISIIMGLQQFGLLNFVASVSNVGMAIFAAVFLASGYGVSGLTYAIVLSATLNFVLAAAIAKRLLPRFRISLSTLQFREVRDLFAFSSKIYIVQVAVVIHTHIEKFLLAYFLGLPQAGMYDVANDLSLKSRAIPNLLIAPLLPGFSELEAKGQHDKVMQLYQRSQKYLAMVGVAIVLLVVLLAHRFVDMWLGPRFAPVAPALIVLTVTQLINLATGPAFFIFISKGDLRPTVYFAMAGIVLNVILSTALIARYGFAGAMIGTAISLSIVSFGLVAVFHKRMNYPARLFLAPYLKPLALGTVLALIARMTLPINRLGWSGMILVSSIVSLSYFAGLVALKYFDAFEFSIAKKVLVMIPFVNFPDRIVNRLRLLYVAPPLHRLVRNRFIYMLWNSGLTGRGPKTVSLISGERIVMRYSPPDFYTAGEVFSSRDYVGPFQIPPDLRNIHDVGGNVGYTTVFLASRFPDSHINVFEPHPEHVQQINLNIALNSLQSRTTVHACAAGAASRKFFLTDAATCSTLTDSPEDGAKPVDVIDWLDLAQKQQIDLLKMDIEGGEYEIIFDPRFDHLRIPYIFMEWHIPPHSTQPSIAKRLSELGYTVKVGPERQLPNGMHYGMIWASLEAKNI
jgi:FkbM family methyltransferase